MNFSFDMHCKTILKLLLFPHRNHPESEARGGRIVMSLAIDADIVSGVEEVITGDF